MSIRRHHRFEWARPLLGAALVVGCVGCAGGGSKACPTLEARGRWVVGEHGDPIERPGSKGLETSSLAYDPLSGDLWSIGDRSSQTPAEFFGHMYRIRPTGGGDTWAPLVEIPFEREALPMSLFRFVTRHKSGHLDFEDLALLGGPSAAREFLAVSESSGPAVLRLQVGADGRVRILGWRELVVPVPSYKNSGNRGLEGLALDAEGGVLYAGLEESKDRTGYLLAYPWPMELDPPEHFDEGRMPVEPLWTKRIHDKRWGEPGPLSGLALARRGGEATLWAVQASTQRLLRLGGRGEPKGCWTLDLRAPDGAAYEVPMPEGVTVDEDHGRLWLVTDPDEKKYRPAGWFRRAKGLYKQGVPMLYEIPIPAAPAPATEVATSARGGA